jgi:hypothetical protein
VPIVFTERARGRSKMSRRIVFEAVLVLLRLSLERLVGRAPKPLAPVAAAGAGSETPARFPESRRAA